MKRIIERYIFIAAVISVMHLANVPADRGLKAAGISSGADPKPVTLQPETCIPPSILVQPSSLSAVRRGSQQTFSVEATGTGPLSYQWYKTGLPAEGIGTNSSSYTISSIAPTDAGYYFAVVTNGCGKDTSKVVSLTLEPTPKSSTVSCPLLAVTPAIVPVATHPCDGTITGVLTSVVDTPDPLICEGTRVYTYSYTTKGGCVVYWSYTYTIRCSGELTPPANTTSAVSGLAEAIDPGAPPEITDACGRKVSAALVGPSTPEPNAVVWTYRYTGCDCNITADWTHTYIIDNSGGTSSLPVAGESDCPIIIPNGFSPNGDDINDYFIITCLAKYPDAKLRIYSGTSVLLYEQEHYGNIDFWGTEDESWWNGTDKDKKKLDSATYIYILDLDPGKGNLIKSGAVFVSR